jgi:hypothetical protein
MVNGELRGRFWTDMALSEPPVHGAIFGDGARDEIVDRRHL